MTTALIGHTGFVGGNLRRHATIDDLYNSTNIEAIRGCSYDLVLVAGAPGEKWKANRDPARDARNLRRLADCLKDIFADHVVLISTVDVYPVPVDVDEETPIDEAAGQPYGRHRLGLERFIRERFDSTVVRLPGLFGSGLKKNIIYDLLNDHMVNRICANSIYQFYNLDWLWNDIQQIRRAGLSLVNCATEPTTVQEVAREAFGFVLPEAYSKRPDVYRFRSKHAALLGGFDGYLYRKERVLEDLRLYVEGAGWKRP